MRMNSGLMLAIVLTALAPGAGWSWGGEGHETVCAIAYLELTPAAKAGVNAILKNAPADEVEGLREGCTWPDRQGDIQTERRPDHFINVPRDWGSIWYEGCAPGTETCLFTAIRRDISKVAARVDKPAEKARALKFLGHWLGDLHQPLHVSFKDDRGGNEVLLAQNIGCREKLHDVWDNCIPEALMADLGVGDSTQRFAEILHRGITKAQRKAWLKGGIAPVAWANESYTIARSPEVEYCVRAPGSDLCAYDEGRPVYGGQGDQRVLHLTDAYEDRHKETVKRRLQQAGVRLGGILNQIFVE